MILLLDIIAICILLGFIYLSKKKHLYFGGIRVNKPEKYPTQDQFVMAAICNCESWFRNFRKYAGLVNHTIPNDPAVRYRLISSTMTDEPIAFYVYFILKDRVVIVRNENGT
jgi:hypothetical protein